MGGVLRHHPPRQEREDPLCWDGRLSVRGPPARRCVLPVGCLGYGCQMVRMNRRGVMAQGTYDIITVGGGLGGSTLAKVMAERGARVLVLERERQFRDRVR